MVAQRSVTAATIAFNLHCSMVHAKESNIEYMSSRSIPRTLLFAERLSWDLLGQLTSCIGTTGAMRPPCEIGSSIFISVSTFLQLFSFTTLFLPKMSCFLN